MFKGSLQNKERKMYPCTYSNYAVRHDDMCRNEGTSTSILTPGTKWKRAVIFVIRHGNRPETLERELGEPKRLLGRRGELK
jgi:hypothetical protein